MMEDAPSAAKGRAVPQDQVNDSRAQHHHSEPAPHSDPVARAVADRQQLRAHFAALSTCVCFFSYIRPIFHHT